MAKPVYPPPPPPLPATQRGGFHGPETRFFMGIRRYLAVLEEGLAPLSKSPTTGLLLALILGATLSFALSFVAQLPAAGLGINVIGVSIAPFTEEIFKGVSILIVALFVWKAIPSRRYGALLGAAAGLGFSISENILYSVQYASLIGQTVEGQLITAEMVTELIVSRWISVPFMHVLWSAFVGIGIFVFIAKRKSSKSSPSWLVLLFPLTGLVNHIVWNAVALGLGSLGAFLLTVLDVLLVFTPFALLFRDFLDGHFNFQKFLAPVQEPTAYKPSTFPPPPPPPPPP